MTNGFSRSRKQLAPMALALAAAMALLAPGAALATPVNPFVALGNAGGYTLLSTSTDTSAILLGSKADIYGNVGAGWNLGMAPGAVVNGNAYYGSLTQGPASSITGSSNTETNAAFWSGLQTNLNNASAAATALGQGIAGLDISGSRTLASYTPGGFSVFNINTLNLSNGGNLTLQGGANDKFVINIDGSFQLGSTSAIDLNGVNPANVMFNFAGSQASFSAANGATLRGIYVAPQITFTLGDGLNLPAVSFLGFGVIGNLQTACGIGQSSGPCRNGGGGQQPPVPVPEPAGLPLMVLGLGFVAYLAYRRRRQTA